MGPSENAIQPPFFLNELILQQNRIISIPTEDQFVEGLSTVVTHFQVILQSNG